MAHQKFRNDQVFFAHDVSCEIENRDLLPAFKFDPPILVLFAHDKIDFDHTLVMNQVESGFVRDRFTISQLTS
jgi:hypothetical protein